MPTKVKYFLKKSFRDKFTKKLEKKNKIVLNKNTLRGYQSAKLLPRYGVTWWTKPKRRKK